MRSMTISISFLIRQRGYGNRCELDNFINGRFLELHPYNGYLNIGWKSIQDYQDYGQEPSISVHLKGDYSIIDN